MHPHTTPRCPVCDNAIPPERLKVSNTRFCSAQCRKASNRDRQIKADNGVVYDIPRSTVGAMHELLVATDLMKRGYHVFRALSPACPSDLLIYKDNREFLRVQVRTARRRRSGEMILSTNSPDDHGRQDVFAFVALDGEIRYVPESISLCP